MASEQSPRWDSHFLTMALHCADMSKDPDTRVGAVIIGPQREVRTTGFNGFPRGVEDTPERLADRELKLDLTVHAELNAILSAARVGVPLNGCTLYIAATDDSGQVWGGAPCIRCTVHVIQAGIARIVSYPPKLPSKWAASIRKSCEILAEVGVEHVVLPYDGARR